MKKHVLFMRVWGFYEKTRAPNLRLEATSLS